MSIVNAIGDTVKKADQKISSIVGRTYSDSKKITPPTQSESGWHLRNLPPEDHPDRGAFFYKLYEDSLRECNRLGLPQRWMAYYQLFRGNHWQESIQNLVSFKTKGKLSIGLLHANITRTVANITARAPVAEVESADGIEDSADQILSEKMRIWNSVEEQQISLAKSVLNMETYGITVEKAIFDPINRQGRTIPLDPYSFLPAPGNFDSLNDMPYLCHIWADNVESIEAKYETEENVVESNEIYSVLGEERQEEFIRSGSKSDLMNFPSDYVPSSRPGSSDSARIRRALVVEMWIRDYSMETRYKSEEFADPETGEILSKLVEYEVPKYPGGIRVVTFTNHGNLILSDQKNPNVNHALPMDIVKNTYLFYNYPFFKANSYEDTSSIWGYPMAETVGDINLEVDKLWSSITNYIQMAMYPPLILPQDTQVHKSRIRYLPRLVIQPVSGNAADHIRFLEMPTPPSWMFEALSSLVSFFDRVSQIEDADRGQAPGSVIAASAIQMLQERGAVLIRAKIRAVDYLIRERGRCFISFYQNFGIGYETVQTPKGTHQVTGLQFIER